MKLVIIIPAYNESETIVGVIKNLPKNIEGIDDIHIAVIDDGSIDDTVDRVKSETNAAVVSHGQNKGVGVAFHTGADYALKNSTDILVSIDADGQFNPKDIPKLTKPILDNQADFVTGSRFFDSSFTPDMPKIKLWGNKLIARLLSWLIKSRFYDVSCGFRAYNKEALLNLNLFGQFTYTQETFLDLSFKGLRIKEVPIKVKYFSQRKSRVYQGAFHYALNTLKIILKTMRDYRPLNFFGNIGFVVFCSGLLFDVFMLVFFIETGSFTPYKWVGFVGIFLNIIGLIFLILALIADMLYRMRINQEKILYYQKKNNYERH